MNIEHNQRCIGKNKTSEKFKHAPKLPKENFMRDQDMMDIKKFREEPEYYNVKAKYAKLRNYHSSFDCHNKADNYQTQSMSKFEAYQRNWLDSNHRNHVARANINKKEHSKNYVANSNQHQHDITLLERSESNELAERDCVI
jgi:hypothetical protein